MTKDVHNFLFIMDPEETLNFATETSILLMQELMERGMCVWWAHINHLSLINSEIVITAQEIKAVEPLSFGPEVRKGAADFTAVMVRPDPPVSEKYLQMTWILDYFPPHVKQYNPSRALRNFNEKLLPLRWPELTIPTLVTNDIPLLLDFLNQHQTIVLKPLNDCSGRRVIRINTDDFPDEPILHEHINTVMPAIIQEGAYLLAQPFLENICKGDKRVFLVNGEPVGMVNRVPSHGSWLGNIHKGATCEATILTPKEKHAINTIGPFLQQEGIMLVGVDFIDGYLTEINITSPSAVRQINDVTQQSIEKKIIDSILIHCDE